MRVLSTESAGRTIEKMSIGETLPRDHPGQAHAVRSRHILEHKQEGGVPRNHDETRDLRER